VAALEAQWSAHASGAAAASAAVAAAQAAAAALEDRLHALTTQLASARAQGAADAATIEALREQLLGRKDAQRRRSMPAAWRASGAGGVSAAAAALDAPQEVCPMPAGSGELA
jgi:hypothetical protein